MQKDLRIDKMLEEGFSEKMAKYFLDGIESENKLGFYDKEYADWAHSQGFFVSHASSYGLNESNVDLYLSDYDYYKIWPLNSWSRIWINDKLTLKYVLYNTKFDKYLPKYYFYSTNGTLRKLMDLEEQKYSSEDIMDLFLEVLRDKGVFATKPNNGAESRGFVKLAFNNGEYSINSKVCKAEDIIDFVKTTPNYIFTEYITPSAEMKKFSDKIHTLRVITINKNGDDPQAAVEYIRFPNLTSGEANYSVFDTKQDVEKNFNLHTWVDIETGNFEKSLLTFPKSIKEVSEHPDNSAALDFVLPNHGEFIRDVLDIARFFSNLEYMGFDFGITDDGYKIMEINSHPGIGTFQLFSPVFENKVLGPWFKEKIECIEALSKENKKNRNGIIR